MNIYEKASNFAKELENCEEVVTLRKVAEKIEKNEESKKILEDFRKLQVEAYTQQMQSGNISNETKEKLEKLAPIISANASVSEYIQAEQKFSMMWDSVLKILNGAIGIDFSFGREK